MHRVNLGFTRLVTPASHILLAITLAITAMRGMHRLLSVLLCEALKDFQRLFHFPTRIETKGQLEVKESMLEIQTFYLTGFLSKWRPVIYSALHSWR